MSHTNLSAAEIALLDSQLPDIGGAIRGKPVTPDGDGWRVGSSTKISKNGRWFDFKAQQGGFGAASFIAHYRSCTPEEAIAWAQSWLAQHPQRGPCGGADEDNGSGEDNADTLQRRAYIESTYAARLLIAGTPAAAYLVGRGLDPAQLRPDIVERMGWLPNHRGAEGALVFPYTDEAGGVLGLHFIFVTPTGEKSPHEPARQTRRGPPDWRAPPAARCCASTLAQGRTWSSRKVLRTRWRSPLSVMPASSPSALSAPTGVAVCRARSRPSRLRMTATTRTPSRRPRRPITAASCAISVRA